MRLHTHTHTHTHMYTCMYTYIHIYVRAWHTSTRARTHTHISTLWFYNRRTIRKCRKSTFRLTIPPLGPMRTVSPLSYPQNKNSEHLKTVLSAKRKVLFLHLRISGRCAQHPHFHSVLQCVAVCCAVCCHMLQ